MPYALSKTLQRYENKSKSQLAEERSVPHTRCLRLCKDTKIKANHNGNIVSFKFTNVV